MLDHRRKSFRLWRLSKIAHSAGWQPTDVYADAPHENYERRSFARYEWRPTDHETTELNPMHAILETRDSKPTAAAGRERRTFGVTEVRVVRSADGRPEKIVGHAAVFDQLSQPLTTRKGVEFREKLSPGCFKRSLESGGAIMALVGHDPDKLLARSDEGTLTLREDETGLAFEITPADTTLARDLIADIEHRNVKGMSFGFGDAEDEWEKVGGENIRTIKSLALGEISATPYPAYTGTEVSVRCDQSIRRLSRRAKAAGGQPAERRATVTVTYDDNSLVWLCRDALRLSRYTFDQFQGVIDCLAGADDVELSDADLMAADDLYDEVQDLVRKARVLLGQLDAAGAADPDDDASDAGAMPAEPAPAAENGDADRSIDRLAAIQRAAELGQPTAELRSGLTPVAAK